MAWAAWAVAWAAWAAAWAAWAGSARCPRPVRPASALQPGQTRSLPTRLVSLNGPTADARVSVPAKDEPLRILDLRELTDNPRVIAAVVRLAEEKAPETVSQLVMWHVAAGLDWTMISRYSKRWATTSELALARQFVQRLDATRGEMTDEDSGRFYIEVETKSPEYTKRAEQLAAMLDEVGLIGLTVERKIPTRPDGPALAARVVLTDTGEAEVTLATTDAAGRQWVGTGKYTVPLPTALPDFEGKEKLSEEKLAELRTAFLADSIAEGALSRLVRAQLTKGPKVKGHQTYKIRIDNVSPMVLNGLAIAGPETRKDGVVPQPLAGISIPPRKSWTVPATEAVVARYGLQDGVRAVAADLSGL